MLHGSNFFFPDRWLAARHRLMLFELFRSLLSARGSSSLLAHRSKFDKTKVKPENLAGVHVYRYHCAMQWCGAALSYSAGVAQWLGVSERRSESSASLRRRQLLFLRFTALKGTACVFYASPGSVSCGAGIAVQIPWALEVLGKRDGSRALISEANAVTARQCRQRKAVQTVNIHPHWNDVHLSERSAS